jgi:hypothetical protein
MGFLSDYFDVTPAGFIVNKVGELIGPAVLNASDQAADIEAINMFFLNAVPVNTKATQLKNDWIAWYSQLGTIDKTTNENTAAEAFNRRNDFFRANAQNQSERDLADAFIKGGPNVNPVTGKPVERTTTGDYAIKPEPKIPTPYKVAGVIGGAGVLVLVILKKLHLI